MNKIEIGKIYKSKNYGEFKVIRKLAEAGTYEIEFVLTKTKMKATSNNINRGAVRDRFYPNVYNVGYVGNVKNVRNNPLYSMWRNMLSRCYNKADSHYCSYGAVGVVVDDRWHSFENFLNDVSKKENYEKLFKKNREWNLDKDLLCTKKNIEPKIYSNDTTLIIHNSINSKMSKRTMVRTVDKNNVGVYKRERGGSIEWIAGIKNPITNKRQRKVFSEKKYGKMAEEMAIKQRKKWEEEILNDEAYYIKENERVNRIIETYEAGGDV